MHKLDKVINSINDEFKINISSNTRKYILEVCTDCFNLQKDEIDKYLDDDLLVDILQYANSELKLNKQCKINDYLSPEIVMEISLILCNW